MKSSAKSGKTALLKPAIVINDAREFDQYSRQFAIAERDRVQIVTEMNDEIEKVKARYRARLTKVEDTKASLLGPIVEYARKLWNNTSTKSVFSYVVINWFIPRGSLEFTGTEEETIAALKKFGRGDLVRTYEAVKKDEFKAAFKDRPDTMGDLGAKIVKPDATGTPDVNWQTLATIDTVKLAKTA